VVIKNKQQVFKQNPANLIDLEHDDFEEVDYERPEAKIDSARYKDTGLKGSYKE
jgi:hypothetical protein